MIDRQKLHEGSPLLLTPGRVTIGVAAGFIGLTEIALLSEVANRRIVTTVLATGWPGVVMPRDDLVRDNIAQPLSSAVYDIGETLGGRDLQPIFGYLFPRPEAIDYAARKSVV